MAERTREHEALLVAADLTRDYRVQAQCPTCKEAGELWDAKFRLYGHRVPAWRLDVDGYATPDYPMDYTVGAGRQTLLDDDDGLDEHFPEPGVWCGQCGILYDREQLVLLPFTPARSTTP